MAVEGLRLSALGVLPSTSFAVRLDASARIGEGPAIAAVPIPTLTSRRNLRRVVSLMVSSPAIEVWTSQQIAKAVIVVVIMKAEQYTGKSAGSHAINRRFLIRDLLLAHWAGTISPSLKVPAYL